MLRLNLVSKELRQEIKLRHVYEVLIRTKYYLIIMVVLVTVIILSAKMILQNSYSRIVEETSLVSEGDQMNNSKIREINAKFTSVEEIQNDFITWSRLLKEIDNQANDDIVFSLMKINKDKQKVDLRGVAKSRDSLLSLKDGLDNSNIFLETDFPIENILEKENINFKIEASLDIKKIK